VARKKPGAYAPLSAYYADDERIMEVGEAAELLYLRMLAYCARTPKTEGYVSLAQVRSRLGIVATGAEDGAETRAERCADAGLLIRENGGYRIASWLKWNRSYEEITRVRAQDQNRKAPVDNAVTSSDDGKRSGSGSGKGTHIGERKRSPFRAPDTDTDTDTDTEVVARKRATQRPDDWKPDDKHRELAEQLELVIDRELEQFIDYHDSKGSTFKDWDAAFRTWLRNAAKWGSSKRNPYSKQQETDDLFGAALERARVRDQNDQQELTR